MTTRAHLASVPLLAAAALLAGCSGDDPAQAAPPSETHEAGAFEVPAGEELVMCTFVRGGNETEADIVAFETEQSLGGHHLIVYTLDHAVDLPPTPCSQGGQPGWNQILVTQLEDEKQAFPAGVGFHVKAHQQYVLETHYINTTSAPLQVSSRYTTTFGLPGAVTQRAATYFFGTMNIDVPPNGALSRTATCQAPFDMTLHTMFGHEHRMGTGVTVRAEQGGSMKPVYETTDWDSPPTTSFEGGLAVSKGQEVHVACDWQNTSADRLHYPHEMCFAIGYYWPADFGVACIAGGGDDSTCVCQFPGATDTGPGGSTVVVNLNRKDDISGVKGELDAGWPIYCALYREKDWSGFLPKEGAEPFYFRDQVDVPLTSTADVATFTITDVTPGDYRVTCMMDTIGGGFVPGPGDVVTLEAAQVHTEQGQTVTVNATLDFAMP